MNAFLLGTALVITGITGAGVVRIAIGPRVFDRVLASNLVAVNGLLLLLIVGFLLGRIELFVDLAIAFALLGFIVPLAAGRLVGGKDER